MKLTIHPDGRREAEGTPAELREFDAGFRLAPPAWPPSCWPVYPVYPVYTPPCTCAQATSCLAHPFGHLLWRPITIGEWNPANAAACAGNGQSVWFTVPPDPVGLARS